MTCRRCAKYEQALRRQIELWHSVPPGPDMEADPDDPCPEDAVAWLAGIAIREAEAALTPDRPGKEESVD